MTTLAACGTKGSDVPDAAADAGEVDAAPARGMVTVRVVQPDGVIAGAHVVFSDPAPPA